METTRVQSRLQKFRLIAENSAKKNIMKTNFAKIKQERNVDNYFLTELLFFSLVIFQNNDLTN